MNYIEYYIYTSHMNPFISYPLLMKEKTDAEKRRHHLFYIMKSKKDIPYKIFRYLLIGIIFVLSLGLSCYLAFLANEFLIGIILGLLSSYFTQYAWLEYIEDFKVKIDNKPFIRRKHV